MPSSLIMGYTILLLWTLNTENRQVSLGDVVLNRVLENYNLYHPVRSTVQFRTFKNKVTTSNGSTTRLLTTIAYSQPIQPSREPVIHPIPKDDVTYVYLDDRKRSEPQRGSVGGTPKQETIDEPEFEIVEKPADTAQTDTGQILAVTPAAAVLPFLQNLLSPFVMGLTKSARAAASTTAETARPTTLPGTSFSLSTLTFAPLPKSMPPLILTVHTFPNPASASILLEAEWADNEADHSVEILKEFLEGCILQGQGERAFVIPDQDTGWSGIEKTKQTTKMIASTLRNAGMI